MFGSVATWLFEGLAGLDVSRLASDRVLTVRPGIATAAVAMGGSAVGVGADAAHGSLLGPAAAAWRLLPGGAAAPALVLNATVPVGATGTVHVVLPGGGGGGRMVVRESGAVVFAGARGFVGRGAAPGVLAARAAGGGEVVFSVSSGSYSFHAVMSDD